MSERRRAWRWVIAGVILWTLCEASALYVGFQFGSLKCAKDLQGYENAIEECAEDLRRNCRGLLDYAGLLEDENGKLHLKIRKLEEKLSER
jgi:hypothetical protein|tara:strand:- start:931 stop:1203 length:273 start_codon:yes stop_codon:yes gene_type:complete